MNDIDLSELANISYLDVKYDLEKYFNKKELTMGKLADYYLNREDIEFKKDNIQDQAIIAALKKYQNEPYRSFKVVDYENNNGTDGLVCLAIETTPGNIVIASRGSEMPGENSIGVGGEDWDDNIKSAGMIETMQQAKAKEFINRVGAMDICKTISITGHSKGGNNALYAMIMANPEIMEKIKQCVTFNAPGFNDDFINANKDIIDKLVEAGIIKEYQGKGDLVSEIMNNISKPIIIKQIDWKGKELIDDHYIYAMLLNGDGTDFIIYEDGRKNFIPILVNSIVDKLLDTLSQEEVMEVINLVEKIINSDDISMGSIIDLLKESDVSASTIGIILIHTLTTATMEFIQSEVRRLKEWIDVPIRFLKNLTSFIVENAVKAKDFIVSNLIRVKESIVKFGKDSIRKILGGPIDISISNLVLQGKNVVIGNFIYNSLTDKKFIVNTDIIKSELRVYKLEIGNLEKCINDVKKTLKKLIIAGWSGKACDEFLNIKFIMYKKAMDKCKEQLTFLVEYLKTADSLFSQRESEEKRLVRIL